MADDATPPPARHGVRAALFPALCLALSAVLASCAGAGGAGGAPPPPPATGTVSAVPLRPELRSAAAVTVAAAGDTATNVRTAAATAAVVEAVGPDFVVTTGDEQAFDEDFAIRYMAQRDARTYARYGDWRIAVVSYNSPARAAAWKRNGYPDPVAEAYANRALVGCGPRSGQVTVTTEKTLARRATAHLGDALRSSEVAELNGLDSTGELEPGQQLRLPQP